MNVGQLVTNRNSSRLMNGVHHNLYVAEMWNMRAVGALKKLVVVSKTSNCHSDIVTGRFRTEVPVKSGSAEDAAVRIQFDFIQFSFFLKSIFNGCA